MKTTQKLFLVAIIVAIVSCKKDNKTITPTPAATDNYNTVWDFFSTNNVPTQVYTINASIGGSFTSPQGTTVTIPANAFLTKSHVAVTGNVSVQFIDIYKKSDMFLANMPTQLFSGAPLKSGGEFFINPTQNNAALIIAPGKKIAVSQPASLTGGVNNAFPMQAFLQKDTSIAATNCTICPGGIWIDPIWSSTNIFDTVQTVVQNYIFNLYPTYDSSSTPNNPGTWCNSDNASYFASYPQTGLTLLAQDSVGTYGTQVFLFFKNISTMVHVYNTGFEDFKYSYAPQGLQCTVVAIGIKGGKLYSSFTPITIGANQTVPFTLSQTTTSAFVAQLKTLD